MQNSTMYTMCIASFHKYAIGEKTLTLWSIQSYRSLNVFVDLLSPTSFNKEL